MSILLTEDRDAVRILTLNRPEVRNALNSELISRLLEALDEAESVKEVRALVLTGSGKAFCAGLDLADLGAISTRSTEENRRDSAHLAALLRRIYTFPKPVVAALNAHAVAGGAGLASVCDLVVMSEAATLGYTGSAHRLCSGSGRGVFGAAGWREGGERPPPLRPAHSSG